MLPKVLTDREVISLLRISPSTLERLKRFDPSFPKKVRLGPRAGVFLEDELTAWIELRAAARTQVAAE